MNQLWIIRAEIEVEPGDLSLDKGFERGFIHIVTWAEAREAAISRIANYLSSFNWKFHSCEEAFPVNVDLLYGVEIQNMIDQAKTNKDAILLGTFHSYRNVQA